jgi:hypothetical protein
MNNQTTQALRVPLLQSPCLRHWHRYWERSAAASRFLYAPNKLQWTKVFCHPASTNWSVDVFNALHDSMIERINQHPDTNSNTNSTHNQTAILRHKSTSNYHLVLQLVTQCCDLSLSTGTTCTATKYGTKHWMYWMQNKYGTKYGTK